MVDFSRSRTGPTASRGVTHGDELGRSYTVHDGNAALTAKVPQALGDDMHMPDFGLDEDLAGLVKAIRVIAQAIDTRSKSMARLSGLTIPQVVLLAAVRDLGEGDDKRAVPACRPVAGHGRLDPRQAGGARLRGTLSLADRPAHRAFAADRSRGPKSSPVRRVSCPVKQWDAIAALPQPERKRLRCRVSQCRINAAYRDMTSR